MVNSIFTTLGKVQLKDIKKIDLAKNSQNQIEIKLIQKKVFIFSKYL
jgi:hypothetical protein